MGAYAQCHNVGTQRSVVYVALPLPRLIRLAVTALVIEKLVTDLDVASYLSPDHKIWMTQPVLLCDHFVSA